MNFFPKKYEKEIITIRIDKETLSKIDELAYKIDISRNKVIVQCIQFALDNCIKI